MIDWTHAVSPFAAAFFACGVESVEALTVILAVGAVRGWRAALGGSGMALLLLGLTIIALGPVILHIPLNALRIVIGALMLLFGLRWLRKAILRAAGVIPLRHEGAAFDRETARLQTLPDLPGWDMAAFATSFQITMLEGTEIVFIVVAMNAGGPGMLWPAGAGAGAALAMVAMLGVIVHRPLARVPENSLKFTAGLLLSALGTFWLGEGLGMVWPGGDWVILALSLGFLLVAGAVLAFGQERPDPAPVR